MLIDDASGADGAVSWVSGGVWGNVALASAFNEGRPTRPDPRKPPVSQGNAAGSLDLAVDPRLSGLIKFERRGGNTIAGERGGEPPEPVAENNLGMSHDEQTNEAARSRLHHQQETASS